MVLFSGGACFNGLFCLSRYLARFSLCSGPSRFHCALCNLSRYKVLSVLLLIQSFQHRQNTSNLIRIHYMNAIWGFRGLYSPEPSASERLYLTEGSYGVQTFRSSLLPVLSNRWCIFISHQIFVIPLEEIAPMTRSYMFLSPCIMDWSFFSRQHGSIMQK